MPAAANAQATPYVPIDDIAYRYVDALMSRGVLQKLSLLERPYRVAAIQQEISAARQRRDCVGTVCRAGPTPRSDVIGTFLDALSEALKRYDLDSPKDSTGERYRFRAKASFDFYATGQTSSLRELMLADWNEDVKPAMGGYFVMGGGHLAASVRALLDNRLNTDPEFAGRKDRSIAGRAEDAYIGGVWKYAEAAFGRVGRSWGPIGMAGLQLGNDSYTYDHLFARIGTEKIHLETVIAKLENYILSPGVESSRYFSTHRLAFKRGAFEGGLSESFLYSGVGRGLEFSLVNPFNVYSLSWRNERTDGNLSFGGDLAWRSRRLGNYSVQVLMDDIQIDRCDSVCREPSSYGFTFTAEGIPAVGDQKLFASYTRVSNLAYHTPNISERYAIYSVGLGRGWSDYDEIRGGIDIALVPRTPLKLYVAHRRQGEGDYRLPYPDESEYATTPAIFAGTIWKTTRLALSGATLIGRDFDLSFDAGVNRSVNRYHTEGKNETKAEGRGRVTWRPRWLVRFD